MRRQPDALPDTPTVKVPNVTSEQLTAPFRDAPYGTFRLSDAVRPSPAFAVVPREGYRRETYRDPAGRIEVPVLAAAASCEKLFDLFLDLLAPLGPTVDVVLETAHRTGGAGHRDLLRPGIDLPVLQSHLVDFEDLLVNDGCTGVAVLSAAGPMEVQFDEHKLLIVYARALAPFEGIFRRHGVRRVDGLKLITEGEHL